MRISTDRGMVRLDLCVDYNRGRVSVYSTEKWGGGGSEYMDQKGRRELGVGGWVQIYGPEGVQRGWGRFVYYYKDGERC